MLLHFLHGAAILNGTGFQKTSQDHFRNRMGTFLFACIALAFEDLNTHLPGLTSWGCSGPIPALTCCIEPDEGHPVASEGGFRPDPLTG